MNVIKSIPRCKAALVCLILLAGVEFGVVRTDWFWESIPNSVAGIVDAVENDVIIQHRGEPIDVLLLGNSRLLDAVPPRELERELKLRPKSVLNLSMTGGTPFDLRHLYESNREELKRARVVVLDFELSYLNGDVDLNDRVQRTATLTDRLDLFSGTPELLPALIGWGWRTYGVRGSFAGSLRQFLDTSPGPSPIADDGRINWPPSGEIGVPCNDEGYITERAFMLAHAPPEFSVWKSQQSTLIRMLREDGAIIILTHVPLRTAIVEAAQSRFPSNAECLVEKWKEHASQCDSTLFIDRGVTINLSDDEFYDYGHLRPSGASKFTKSLAAHMRTDRLCRRSLSTVSK